jgi:hypothetical protein
MAMASVPLSRTLCAAVLCAVILTRGAQAADTAPCPPRPATALKSVEVFDGAPEELASLMPDEADKNSGSFALGYIYEAGRFVTIRCEYADKSTADVKLAAKVESCKYAIGKDKKASFSCHNP